jgi:hypothetical protein
MCHVDCQVKREMRFIVVAIKHDYATNSLVLCQVQGTTALSFMSLVDPVSIVPTQRNPGLWSASNRNLEYNSDQPRTKECLKPFAKYSKKIIRRRIKCSARPDTGQYSKKEAPRQPDRLHRSGIEPEAQAHNAKIGRLVCYHYTTEAI